LNLKRRHLDSVTWGEFATRYITLPIANPSASVAENSTIISVEQRKQELVEQTGIPLRSVERYLEAARLPEPYREKVRMGTLTLNAAKKEQRAVERSRADPPPLPTAIYRTIVADPPWEYERGDIRGAAKGHYEVMPIDKVAALPIRELAGEEAHLYLWVTNPHLPLVWPIVEAWGFQYKTLLTWCKPQMGTGFYFRSATEHIIFATRGNLPLRDRGIPNWFEAERTKHSEKPNAFYEIVERASHPPYLELFARRERQGWTTWGAEVS